MLSDQSPFGPLPSVVARKSANARAAIRVVRPSGKYACTGKSAIFQSGSSRTNAPLASTTAAAASAPAVSLNTFLSMDRNTR